MKKIYKLFIIISMLILIVGCSSKPYLNEDKKKSNEEIEELLRKYVQEKYGELDIEFVEKAEKQYKCYSENNLCNMENVYEYKYKVKDKEENIGYLIYTDPYIIDEKEFEETITDTYDYANNKEIKEAYMQIANKYPKLKIKKIFIEADENGETYMFFTSTTKIEKLDDYNDFICEVLKYKQDNLSKEIQPTKFYNSANGERRTITSDNCKNN